MSDDFQEHYRELISMYGELLADVISLVQVGQDAQVPEPEIRQGALGVVQVFAEGICDPRIMSNLNALQHHFLSRMVSHTSVVLSDEGYPLDMCLGLLHIVRDGIAQTIATGEATDIRLDPRTAMLEEAVEVLLRDQNTS